MLSAEISKHEGDGNAYVAAPGDAEKMRQAQSLLATTGFPMSAKSLGRLATILDSQCTQDEYSKAIREVRNRLEDESEGFFLIHIESTRAFYFDKRFDQLTSPAVSTTLPTISTDFVEASNCYALGRWTAAVFHLMRVMEESLRVFAEVVLEIEPTVLRKDGLFAFQSWESLDGMIRAQISSMPESTLEEKEQKRCYLVVQRYWNDIRLVWRNPVSHPGEHCDDGQSWKIYRSVSVFLEELGQSILKYKPTSDLSWLLQSSLWEDQPPLRSGLFPDSPAN